MGVQRKKSGTKGDANKGVDSLEIRHNKGDLTEFSVDKGVPMPIKSERDSLVGKFPLKKMEIGDSFLVQKNHNRKTQNSLSCSIRQYCKSKKIKHKFSVFKDPESDFIRVWRSC